MLFAFVLAWDVSDTVSHIWLLRATSPLDEIVGLVVVSLMVFPVVEASSFVLSPCLFFSTRNHKGVRRSGSNGFSFLRAAIRNWSKFEGIKEWVIQLHVLRCRDGALRRLARQFYYSLISLFLTSAVLPNDFLSACVLFRASDGTAVTFVYSQKHTQWSWCIFKQCESVPLGSRRDLTFYQSFRYFHFAWNKKAHRWKRKRKGQKKNAKTLKIYKNGFGCKIQQQ